MANSGGSRKHVRRPAWQMHLSRLRCSLTHMFSDDDSYDYSRWGSWQKRIQQAHDREKGQIQRIYDEYEKTAASDPRHDPDEWAGEEYSQTCDLTNAMYAALVVSIWSEMERFLKDTVLLCYRALEKRKGALQQAQTFCEDSLAGKKPDATLRRCISALKELDAGIPYRFDDIAKALKNEVHVDIDQCAEYPTINAIRILNNSFKHNRGYYQPEGDKPHAPIDAGLLKRWSVIDKGDAIDYSKLPMKELVVACNSFCNDLLCRVEAALNERFAGGKR